MTERFKKHLDLNIYQIYPRSFCDANGDGIGDLQGVTAKLDYLVELGVNAIWLCPCFKSPNEDNGYDVADYCDIMDEFGTMEDMKQLIQEMHARGMKLILDLVPNHTSSEHRWFRESRKSRDNPYSDYYYWFDTPPNHWQSCFGGTAYQYDEGRGQYYLHSYAVGQPDLNWENPKVVEEMQRIVDFWVDMGADGFRIDVIDQISKDFANGKNCFGPRLHEFIHALFGRHNVRHIFTVGECWCSDIDEIMRHCAEERGELVTLFQFAHLGGGRDDKWLPSDENKKLKYVRDMVAKWQRLSEEKDLVHALFTDNHDNNFLLSRVADDRALRYESATMLATMMYMMRGTTFIYQGQEIGSVASHFDSIEDFRDVESLNYYRLRIEEEGESEETLLDKVNFGSRDNTRRPFAWNGEKYCGFSEAEPWIMPPSRCKEIHLEADRAAEKSVFRYYQAVLKLRREDTIRYGSFRMLNSPDDNCFVYERTLGNETYLVVCNFEHESRIDIPTADLVLTNYQRDAADTGVFRPYEAAVYRLK